MILDLRKNTPKYLRIQKKKKTFTVLEFLHVLHLFVWAAPACLFGLPELTRIPWPWPKLGLPQKLLYLLFSQPTKSSSQFYSWQASCQLWALAQTWRFSTLPEGSSLWLKQKESSSHFQLLNCFLLGVNRIWIYLVYFLPVASLTATLSFLHSQSIGPWKRGPCLSCWLF